MEDEHKIFYAGVKKIISTGQHRMTQAELGDKIGRDQTTISGYFRGRTSPPGEIPRIAEALGIEYSDILSVGRQGMQMQPLESPATALETEPENKDLLFTIQILKENSALLKKDNARLEKENAELKAKLLEEPTGPSMSSNGTLDR